MGLILRFFYTPSPQLDRVYRLKRGAAPETGSLQTPSSSRESHVRTGDQAPVSSSGNSALVRQTSRGEIRPLLRRCYRRTFQLPFEKARTARCPPPSSRA